MAVRARVHFGEPVLTFDRRWHRLPFAWAQWPRERAFLRGLDETRGARPSASRSRC